MARHEETLGVEPRCEQLLLATGDRSAQGWVDTGTSAKAGALMQSRRGGRAGGPAPAARQKEDRPGTQHDIAGAGLGGLPRRSGSRRARMAQGGREFQMGTEMAGKNT